MNTGSLEPEITLLTTVLGILKLEWASESPGGLTNRGFLDPDLRVSHSIRSGVERQILHLYHLPGTAAPGTTF